MKKRAGDVASRVQATRAEQALQAQRQTENIAVRSLSRSLREAEQQAVRDAFRQQLLGAAVRWITPETLEARIEAALDAPVGFTSTTSAGSAIAATDGWRPRVGAPRMTLAEEVRLSRADMMRTGVEQMEGKGDENDKSALKLTWAAT